jgi:trimethylamine--corrinoid protein Co-methyltransferase
LPVLELLTKEELQTIHDASLKVLENKGIKFQNDQALNYLKRAGAEVDSNAKIAKFSGDIVESWIRKAPAEFTWRARNPKHSLHVGGDFCWSVPGYGCNYILDLNGNRRLGTIKDVSDLTRLVDFLPHVDAGGGLLVEPSDLAPRVAFARTLFEMIRNTGKCVMGYTLGRDVARDSIELASILVGGESELSKNCIIVGLINPKSPLEYDSKMIEGLIEYSKRSLPTIIASLTISGATGPVTLAGALVQHNAEVLSGVVLSQSIRPGTPNIYGSASCIMDMRTGVPSTGSPEAVMFQSVVAQLARFYGLPSRGSSLVSDSKSPDAQSSYEKAIGAVLGGLSNVNLNTWAGVLEYYMTISPAQLVIDSEVWGAVSRIKRGVEFSSVSIAIDVIKEGASKGNFLGHKHTLENLMKEQWFPSLSDRRSYSNWKAGGSLDASRRAIDLARKTLSEYTPYPLRVDVEQELKTAVQNIEKIAV